MIYTYIYTYVFLCVHIYTYKLKNLLYKQSYVYVEDLPSKPTVTVWTFGECNYCTVIEVESFNVKIQK